MRALTRILYDYLGNTHAGVIYFFDSPDERDRYVKVLWEYHSNKLSRRFGIPVPLELEEYEDCTATGPIQLVLRITTTLRFIELFRGHYSGWVMAHEKFDELKEAFKKNKRNFFSDSGCTS